jgi:hypothetical protein
MRVHVQRPLMNACGEGRVQTLRQPLGDNEFAWDLFVLHISLKGLQSACTIKSVVGRSKTRRDETRRRNATYLQQFGEKCNEVCPFVYAIKRRETLFDLLCIFLVFRIGREGGAGTWKDAR